MFSRPTQNVGPTQLCFLVKPGTLLYYVFLKYKILTAKIFNKPKND